MIRGAPNRLAKRGADSFTLVEMIVATAIVCIMMAVLMTMLSTVMTAWQEGQARDERRTAAQLVFDRMTRDLRQVTLPSALAGSYCTNAANSLEFVINPSSISTNCYPQSVFWQAPVASDGSTSGNLAIVGYFVQWVNGAPNLSRVLINPSFTGVYDLYSNPSTWISNTLLTNAPASASYNYLGLMAYNVLGLWVQALDPNGNPIKQTSTSLAGESFDSRLSYSYTNSVYTNVAYTNMAPTLPASVQIAVMVIDSRTAKLLKGTEMPTTNQLTGNFWNDIQTFQNTLSPAIKKNSQILTTTVDLPNCPR